MLCVLYWQLNKKLVCLYPTLEKSHLSLHSMIIAFHNVKTTFVTQTQTYFPEVYLTLNGITPDTAYNCLGYLSFSL